MTVIGSVAPELAQAIVAVLRGRRDRTFAEWVKIMGGDAALSTSARGMNGLVALVAVSAFRLIPMW